MEGVIFTGVVSRESSWEGVKGVTIGATNNRVTFTLCKIIYFMFNYFLLKYNY